MKYSISVNVAQQLLYVNVKGSLTAEDIEGYYASLKEIDGVNICQKALIDITGPKASMKSVPVKSLKFMGMMFKNAPLLPQGAKMAIVVTTSLAYGFIRLFMANRGEGIKIRPFKHMNEALVWLNISESMIPKV
ncbi:MAG: hypothetical protein R8M46_01540 [Ghiorsea sp.]